VEVAGDVVEVAVVDDGGWKVMMVASWEVNEQRQP